jgi:Glyoxalase/Bleomycin resistance protein/Dioxygenase superfamily
MPQSFEDAALTCPEESSMIEINGIAHIQLTVNYLQRAMPFYEDVMGFMGMKAVVKAPNGLYMIGGRTSVAITRSSEANRKRRVRSAAHWAPSPLLSRPIEGRDRFLVCVSRPARRADRSSPRGWIVGSGLLEVNFVPAKGHFEHPEELPLKTMPGYENYPA